MTNHRNDITYAVENPRILKQKPLKSPSLCVWSGVYYGGIIGPYYFERTCTGETYLQMLQELIIPELRRRGILNTCVWQQDGAPPHWSRDVRDFLTLTFGHRWIGRNGPTEWPPRSPDLTPPDFFLWGHAKEKVYGARPQSLEHLQELIQREIDAIPRQMCRNAVDRSLRERLQACIDAQGGHIVYTHG